MSEPLIRDGVVRLPGPDGTDARTRWLSSGYDGGYCAAPAAYNVTVPEGFDRADLDVYGHERRDEAGFGDGPTLLTGVSQGHARVARAGPVTAVATVGLSNPAALPMDLERGDAGEDGAAGDGRDRSTDWRLGTVNVLVAADRPLTDGGLASLHGVTVEARTATLLAETGFPGTTSDAAVVGCGHGDPGGGEHGDDDAGIAPSAFAGSATEVGDAARACVRDAVVAGLASRYGDEEVPASVADARYGVTTDRRAAVSAVPTDTKD